MSGAVLAARPPLETVSADSSRRTRRDRRRHGRAPNILASERPSAVIHGPLAAMQALPPPGAPGVATTAQAPRAGSRQTYRGLRRPPALVEPPGEGPGTLRRRLALRRGGPAHDALAGPAVGLRQLARYHGPHAGALLQAVGQHGAVMVDHRRLPVILPLLVGAGPVDQLDKAQQQHSEVVHVRLARILDLLGDVRDVEGLARARPDQGGLGLCPTVDTGVIVRGVHASPSGQGRHGADRTAGDLRSQIRAAVRPRSHGLGLTAYPYGSKVQ